MSAAMKDNLREQVAKALAPFIARRAPPRSAADAALAVMQSEAAPAIIDALWPILGGNHTDDVIWHQISNAVLNALGATHDHN